MAEIGKTNRLEVLRATDCGLMLDGDNLGEILMPNRYVSKEWKVGDVVEVFLMLDSEDRLPAGVPGGRDCIRRYQRPGQRRFEAEGAAAELFRARRPAHEAAHDVSGAHSQSESGNA